MKYNTNDIAFTNTITKIISLFLVFCIIFSLCGVQVYAADVWQKLFDKYSVRDDVTSLIFVKYTGGSNARLYMYQKSGSSWNEVLSCKALVGENGIDKVKEGDRRTPTGNFKPTISFGLKKNPGTALKYRRLNKYLYWSGDKETYNKLVDKRKYPNVTGEHLIDHNPSYTYALDMGYNKKGVYKKGSALFMHCYGKGNYTSTLGCVAVKKSNMKKILRLTNYQTRICIHHA